MAEANQEAFQNKTLHLKVSIHCEGCKKKVKRVLEKIPGVEKVEIDSYQHKVSVTCRVDHDTLIRKLQKSNKQASVWPEAKKPASNPAPSTSSETNNQKKESNSKPKDKEPKESSEKPKEKQPEPAKDKSSDKGDENEKAKEKPKPKAEDETKSKDVVKEKPKEKEKEKEKDKEKDVVKEKPKEEKKEKEKEKEKEKVKEHSEKEAKQNTGGENKKEKAEQKEKKIESSGNEGPQHVERGFGPAHPNQEFMNPYSYPYPPQPIMSYHMAQPSSSQAYYQQPPMPGMQNYMHPYQNNPYPNNPYSYPYQYQYGAPSDYQYGSTESSSRGHESSLDSYFNEENANSCSIM